MFLVILKLTPGSVNPIQNVSFFGYLLHANNPTIFTVDCDSPRFLPPSLLEDGTGIAEGNSMKGLAALIFIAVALSLPLPKEKPLDAGTHRDSVVNSGGHEQ
jgi:hypothetical protein